MFTYTSRHSKTFTGNIRPLDEGGDVKPLYMHHVNPTVSRDPVPLYRSTPRCISSQTPNLIKVHGMWTVSSVLMDKY